MRLNGGKARNGSTRFRRGLHEDQQTESVSFRDCGIGNRGFLHLGDPPCMGPDERRY
jgi:hypothetical protein